MSDAHRSAWGNHVSLSPNRFVLCSMLQLLHPIGNRLLLILPIHLLPSVHPPDWFYLSTDYEFIWLLRDEKVPERERHIIQSKKFMLTIVWDPRGFHLNKVLEKAASSTPAIISLRY
jgi:hypothetical protein